MVDGTDAIISQLSLDPTAAEAKAAQAAQAARAPAQHFNPLGAIIPLIFLFFVISSIFGRGRRGGGMGMLLPLLFLSSGRGGWGDGGGGLGGGGGGFSGGGGSGGGGGASGSW